MNTYHVYTVRMGPTFNGRSALQRFERGNAIEIRNGIMFDFYLGLPHIGVNKLHSPLKAMVQKWVCLSC